MGLFLLGALALMTVVVLCFPETQVAQSLQRYLFEPVAQFLDRMTLPKLIFLVALVAGSFVFAYAFPMEIALLAAGDMAAYAEIMAAVMLMNAGTRLKATFTHLKAFAMRALTAVAGIARFNTRRATRAVRLHIRKIQVTRDDSEDRPLSAPRAMAA
ncbi:hypothetical protein PQU92_01050 [Asticcacaulis sp. BYS171W]|uniref:Uncharacterized protein n=1 Tax=Asticcacaulis aquaticus TaxID=2984212 RepID=A0ABT5HPV1_9CAUL|nr:hypothetical protein [Asticcacaulis aquaticus]MDC7681845.1 hypothetical protein [Asticcacaulis aquaticus]